MSQSAKDRQPLLPTHHSSGSRLDRPKISFPSSTSSALAPTDNDHGDGDTEAVQTYSTARRWSREPLVKEERQGVPKLSRECLWSEIKCYGSYILPVLIVFGVLVIGVSLGVVGWKQGWFK